MSTDEMVPNWLRKMLRAIFFKPCQTHFELRGNERNLFCLDCQEKAFCNHCSYHHNGHRILQVRKSSYSYVVRVDDLGKYLDVSDIQTYTINNAKIVFLTERPKKGPGRCPKALGCRCQICRRGIHKEYMFCSVGCKLQGVHLGYADVSLALRSDQRGNMLDSPNQEMEIEDSVNQNQMLSGEDNQLKEDFPSSAGEASSSVPPPNESEKKRHRRKGIPRRSPLM